MANIFNSIRVPKLKRNKFNLSHDVCLTAEFGTLFPILCEEVVPGETYQLSTQQLVRLAPLRAPYMSQVDVFTYSFFVPNRLLWDGWKDFITGKNDDLVKPYLHTTYHINTDSKGVKHLFTDSTSTKIGHNLVGTSTLIDYLGFPTLDASVGAANSDGTMDLDAFPLYAYHLICDEYFRDQNLQDSYTENLKLQSGQNTCYGLWQDQHPESAFYKLLRLRNKCWKKDYFTSALTEPQASSDIVGHLPFNGQATADFDVNTHAPIKNKAGLTKLIDAAGKPISNSQSIITNSQGVVQDSSNKNARFDLTGSNYADLSGLSADVNFDESSAVLNINELRRLYRIQTLLERDNRGGGRYVEQLLSHFGVKSSDGRLQRPEFLGGSKLPIQVGEVLQTSESTANSPLAQPAGNGVGAGSSRQFRRFFEEHGWLMTIMCVVPKPYYCQGMPRKFSRQSRFDYYWPEFAHLGEQAILQKELYYQPNNNQTNNDVFGYTPRYAEYKFSPNRICGDFKNSLSFWHLGRIFKDVPRLNSDFVTMKSSEVNRIFAVEGFDEEGNEVNNYDHLWIQVHNDLQKLSPMPKYGTPMF